MPFQPQYLCLWQGLSVSFVLHQLQSFMSTDQASTAGLFWGELKSQGHYTSTADRLSYCRTWRGNNGEEWSSAQGLESTLISIQSLLSSNPYENEPGYEDASSKPDQDNMKNYVAKVKCHFPTKLPDRRPSSNCKNLQIRHENLRLAVIEPLERALGIGSAKMIEQANQMDDLDDDDDDIGPGAFSDLRKSRFLWYYECHLLAIAEGEAEKNRKRKFEKMPFEGPGNIMDGHFNYPELRQRLEAVREAIMTETKAWSVEGRAAGEQEAGIAANLVRQREQIVEIYKARSNFTLDLHLADGNPFVWELSYFGRPMTRLDGGIFNFIIHLSPRFPEEQPRVFVQPPLFHYRVSNHGVLCYFPERPEEMQNHVDAIVAALEEEAPYDPRATVNPEATRLFWGSPDDRKQYNRRLRRSVERSTE